MLDNAAGCQLHGSFQQAVGDRRAVLQETGLLPGAQGHVGLGQHPKNCGQGWGQRTYIHVGMGRFAEAEVAGRARQERQAADVVARRGGHVVIGCVRDTGCREAGELSAHQRQM